MRNSTRIKLQRKTLPQGQSALKWGLGEEQPGSTPSGHTGELSSPVLPQLTQCLPHVVYHRFRPWFNCSHASYFCCWSFALQLNHLESRTTWVGFKLFYPFCNAGGKNSDCLLYKSEQFASVQSWTTEQLWWFPTIKRCRKAASLLTWGLVAPRLQLHPYFKVSGIENAGWRLGGMHAKNRSCNL